jgi:hypothetical protein
VPEPSAFEVEMAIEELKRHKSDTEQIPAALIKAGDRTLPSEINKLINSIWNKKDLPDEKKESNIVPIYKKGDETDCSNYRGISLCQKEHKNKERRLCHVHYSVLQVYVMPLVFDCESTYCLPLICDDK